MVSSGTEELSGIYLSQRPTLASLPALELLLTVQLRRCHKRSEGIERHRQFNAGLTHNKKEKESGISTLLFFAFMLLTLRRLSEIAVYIVSLQHNELLPAMDALQHG